MKWFYSPDLTLILTFAINHVNQSINKINPKPYQFKWNYKFYILTWDDTSVWRRSYIHHTRIFYPGEPSPCVVGDHTRNINDKIKHPTTPPHPENIPILGRFRFRPWRRIFLWLLDYFQIRISDFKCWDQLLCHEKDFFTNNRIFYSFRSRLYPMG